MCCANSYTEYAESLINNDIQHFVLLLSKDREWRDNHAIQATADAFGVSTEIINSNSASFTLVTVLLQGIPQNLVKKHLFFGHIDQIHSPQILGEDLQKDFERGLSIHAL